MTISNEHSANDLARLSGVSVRTLHYYDEIGLLKPLYRSSYGRRYYGIDQHLRLQKILYFKELGFPLDQIQTILCSKHINEISILKAQRDLIIKEIDRLKGLVNSINKTICHYQGETMTNKEVCDQYKNAQKMSSDLFAEFESKYGPEIMGKSFAWAKENPTTAAELPAFGKAWNESLIKLIEADTAPDSEEVQALLQYQTDFMKAWNAKNMPEELATPPLTKEAAFESLKMYQEEESAQWRIWKLVHPKAPEFLHKALTIFYERRFK